MYTEPPQWRRIGVNGALFAQSEGGNVGGSEDRLIAAFLLVSENAIHLRSPSVAKQNMMLQLRPRNACRKADSWRLRARRHHHSSPLRGDLTGLPSPYI